MLRVVQIVAVATPGTDGNRGVNGPELRALNSLAWTDSSTIRTTIVYPSVGRLWDRFRATGVDLVDFEVRGKYALHSVRTLCEIIASRDADLVHTQGSGAIDLFACMAARRCGIRFVLTRPVMIEDLPIAWWRRIAYQAVDLWTLSRADAVVAVSQDGYRRLAALGIPASRLHLIYNGIDLRRFRQTSCVDRAAIGIPSHVPVVGACAQLTATKAWDDFLEVLSLLRQRLPAIHGLIVGDGPMRARLEARCRELDLQDAVKFSGFMGDVASALHCMDVYLSMSKAEGLSVGLIEAMAAGLPAIVTNVGGTREQVLDGSNGFIVEVGDREAAAAAVHKVLADEVLRRQMSTAALQRAGAMFDVSKMVAGYLEVYRSTSNATS